MLPSGSDYTYDPYNNTIDVGSRRTDVTTAETSSSDSGPVNGTLRTAAE